MKSPLTNETILARLEDTAKIAVVPEWLRKELTTTADRLRLLDEAIKLARNTFEGYAAIHREKVTPDGDVKAQYNQDLANRMTCALQGRPIK